MSSDWEKRLAEIQAAKEAERQKKDNIVSFPAAQSPELPDELAAAVPDASLTHEDKEVAEHIQSADQRIASQVESIGILQAYDMWIGKMKPNPTPGNPEVFVSCPLPDHADANPSACANTETNLWMCYRCQEGGDILDLAAIKYNMPDYKQGQNFHNLYRKIAENDFGWKFENQGGFQVGLSPEDQVKKAKAAEQRLEEHRAQLEQQKGELPPNNVIDIETGEEPDDDDDFAPDSLDLPTLDWRPLVKEGTFLDYYMKECIKDTSPEEYHFWNGLMAISLAVGRNVEMGYLKSNLFICHIGESGVGKSRSHSSLVKVLEAAMPYDEDNPSQDGVFILDSIQSAEGMVKDFSGEYIPRKGGKPVAEGRIKGIANWDEMSSILNNSKRGVGGNNIKQKMNEFYDCKDVISTRAASSRNVAKLPFACVSTSIQPENLKDGLAKEDITSGFLNRFVFVSGTRKPQRAIDDHVYDFTQPVLALQRVHLWYNKYSNTELDYEVTTLGWNPEARDLWTEFHDRIVDPTIAKGNGAVSRLGTLMKKLIMIFAINNLETEISADSVQRAIGLWDYLIKSYMAVSGSVLQSAGSEVIDNIYKLCLKLQEKRTRYVTVKEVHHRRPKYSIREITMAFDDLCRAGMMEKHDGAVVSSGKRGRPITGPCYLPIPEVGA